MLAGFTVASILIPQSVSYATSLAKMSPVTGLVCKYVLVSWCETHLIQFSASIPGIVYALLGTSRQLNVAPEAALSLLVGQAVSDVLHGDPHNYPGDPDAVSLLVATAVTIQVSALTP